MSAFKGAWRTIWAPGRVAAKPSLAEARRRANMPYRGNHGTANVNKALRKYDEMKTLVLMRHAKSAWDNADLPDIERPLSPRGQKAAPLVGERLKKAGYHPDVILCSTARRTRETLDLITLSLPKKAKVQYLKELYMAVPREMLNLIAKTPDSAQTVMLVGHNPGIGSLAGWLAGEGDSELLSKIRRKFPTAAAAVITFDVTRWSEVAGEGGVLAAFLRPRDADDD
jgi:phosphohistidine phosphatase